MTCRGTKGVLADDLTGSMDAGVQMVRHGARVRVSILGRNLEWLAEAADVIVVDTESRNIPAADAYDRVSRAVEALSTAGIPLIYKKIDSTLRGNIGAEIDAVLDRAEALIVVAPALPHNGRTTVDGCHYVNGVPLADTELANDPFSPVRHSRIEDIIRLQSRHDVAHAPLAQVRQGPRSLLECFCAAQKRGCRIVVADAVVDDDLAAVVEAGFLFEDRVLLCGSAGLFRHMQHVLRDAPASVPELPLTPRAEPVFHRSPSSPAVPSRRVPVLVVSGSPARIAKEQIDYAVRHLVGTTLITLDDNALTAGAERFKSEVKRVGCQVRRALLDGMNVIIDGAGPSKQEILNRYGHDRKLLNERSNTILNALAEVVAEAVNEREPAGLVLVGGDTAVRICARFGCDGIEVAREIEPFVPAGTLLGGRRSGMPVVTKAGGFGEAATIARAIEYLHHREGR